MACPEPDVMEVEGAYFGALAVAVAVEALADGLVIRSDDSRLMFEPVAALP